METVSVTIPKDPKKPVQVDVAGHKGSGCQALTEGIQKALGATVTDNQTSEYFESNVTNEQQQQLG